MEKGTVLKVSQFPYAINNLVRYNPLRMIFLGKGFKSLFHMSCKKEMQEKRQYEKSKETCHESNVERHFHFHRNEDHQGHKTKAQEHMDDGIKVLLYCLLLRIPVQLRPGDIEENTNLIDHQ